MIDNFQIKGLEKLANSGIIKQIYPMIDHIEIHTNEDKQFKHHNWAPDTIDVDIFLNDPEITSLNMYDKELDPHYLVDKYLKEYFPYFNINNSIVDFIVWGTDGEVIYSWKN
jgi:hypothetical protein